MNPGYFRQRRPRLDIHTSIDSLSPGSPLLPVLLTAHSGPWVSYHNIMGDTHLDGIRGLLAGGRGDGVVTIESASLDDATSQLVVDADHSMVHRHPESILEVQRILLQQVEELRNGLKSRGIQQVAVPDEQTNPNELVQFPPTNSVEFRDHQHLRTAVIPAATASR